MNISTVLRNFIERETARRPGPWRVDTINGTVAVLDGAGSAVVAECAGEIEAHLIVEYAASFAPEHLVPPGFREGPTVPARQPAFVQLEFPLAA